MMLQPSARQRQVSRLRQAAAEKGLMVYLSDLDDASGVQVASYILPVVETQKVSAEWCIAKQKTKHDVHFYEQWDWRGEGTCTDAQRPRLKKILAELPKDIVGLGKNTIGVYVFWLEKSAKDEERAAVENVFQILRRLAALLDSEKEWALS